MAVKQMIHDVPVLICAGLLAATGLAAAEPFHEWAAAPTMGWNSWDFYGTTVTEDQIKAQADYMATNLLSHGWDLITVDIQWYAPYPEADGNYFNYETPNADLVMDANGRLQPATTRFPSAAGGVGFKPLADYVHAKGLRFGIHMMRGIPRYAVDQDLPIYGTPYTAQDIADTGSTCSWNPDMYGVDMSAPGAQEYYNSLYDMYASWGVDFVKIDDISRPYDTVQQAEIEAIRAAIDQTGREIVFSLSPGETPLTKGGHVVTNANQWRISDDFWDNWGALYDQFQRLHDWTPYRGPGYFPDADMLPLGKVHASGGDPDGRSTYFSDDEQYTLMSLWAIARSPLIHGGDMTQMDPLTLSLMTNDEVIAVNQQSTHNRQLYRNGDLVAWVADAMGSSNKYLAVFNTGGSSSTVPVDLPDLGYYGSCTIRSLWDQTDLGAYSGTFTPSIASHGTQLYRISGEVVPTPWLIDVSVVDGQVTLVWEAIDSAGSYTVKRALAEGGPYAIIADGISDATYTDAAVTNGVAYYYTVSAVVGGQESPDSNMRYAIPASATGIVSWNYNRYGDSPTGDNAVAGVIPAPYWNDTWFDAGNTGTSMSDLRDSTGARTPINISWSSYNAYSIQHSHPGTDSDGSYNREILNGYINDSSASVTLSGIPYVLYDIVVCFVSDNDARNGTVTDGTTTYSFNILDHMIEGADALFVQTTAMDLSYPEANYAVFSNLTGSVQTITASIPDWGGIAAVQVLGKSDPLRSAALSIMRSTNSPAFILSWPDDLGTVDLQSCDNLVSGSWLTVSSYATNSASVAGNGDQVFYRLSR